MTQIPKGRLVENPEKADMQGLCHVLFNTVMKRSDIRASFLLHRNFRETATTSPMSSQETSLSLRIMLAYGCFRK